MKTLDTANMNHELAEIHDVNVSVGKIKENFQVTVQGTGWTAEEKERMEKFGYDSLDMVRAWYS